MKKQNRRIAGTRSPTGAKSRGSCTVRTAYVFKGKNPQMYLTLIKVLVQTAFCLCYDGGLHNEHLLCTLKTAITEIVSNFADDFPVVDKLEYLYLKFQNGKYAM